MKKLVTVMIITLILVLSANPAESGTLDRGVSIDPVFTAGGSANGNPAILQLKYQMAVDSKVGIKDRYKTVYTTIVSYDIYESYDSHDTVISVNTDIGEGEVVLNTNPVTYKDNASSIVLSVNAEIGEGGITLNTQ